MIRCSGICKSGQQCKRMIKNGNVCKTHYTGECSVCLEQITTSKVKTKCGHFFHKSCIEKWLEQQNTCPICRIQLVDFVTFRISIYPSNLSELHFEIDILSKHAHDIDVVVQTFYDILIYDQDFQNITNNNIPYRFEISIAS